MLACWRQFRRRCGLNVCLAMAMRNSSYIHCAGSISRQWSRHPVSKSAMVLSPTIFGCAGLCTASPGVPGASRTSPDGHEQRRPAREAVDNPQADKKRWTGSLRSGRRAPPVAAGDCAQQAGRPWQRRGRGCACRAAGRDGRDRSRRNKSRSFDTRQQRAPTQSARAKPSNRLKGLERVNGIEPSSSAWKAVALPLSYTRGTRR